ncbi:MAG: hypothetical protein ACLUNV_08210 [Sutterella wadsworthensis]
MQIGRPFSMPILVQDLIGRRAPEAPDGHVGRRLPLLTEDLVVEVHLLLVERHLVLSSRMPTRMIAPGMRLRYSEKSSLDMNGRMMRTLSSPSRAFRDLRGRRSSAPRR